MRKKNITYILGAGASYHAIPVVNTINERMRLFLDMYENFKMTKIPNDDIPSYYKNYLKEDKLFSEYKEVVNEALKHRTVDTYAKKLWLTKQNHKLYLLKKFLCLYFAFEQSTLKDKLIMSSNYDNAISKKYQSIKDHVDSYLDYRYDVFLATLLNENLELPSNISILSWNYDYQLELAYMQYKKCRIGEARQDLEVFPRDLSRATDEEIGKKIGSIIKLNGSANQVCFPSIKDERSAYTIDVYLSEEENFIKTLSYLTDKKDLRDRGELALNFAWEKPSYFQSIMKKSKAVLAFTDILVIIGYSFPYFNRSIDSELFGSLNYNLLDEVKVQCDENDYNMVKQNFVDVAPQLDSKVVEYHNDLSQFYIPTIQFANS